MPIINSIASWLMKKRMHQIELFVKYPIDVQQEWMYSLLKDASKTKFGKKYHYTDIMHLITLVMMDNDNDNYSKIIDGND